MPGHWPGTPKRVSRRIQGAAATGSYVAPNPPVNKATRDPIFAELDRRIAEENRHGGVQPEADAGSKD